MEVESSHKSSTGFLEMEKTSGSTEYILNPVGTGFYWILGEIFLKLDS